MISLSIHAMRFFTNATAFDLSMACTWIDTASGMGRSMMSARQRSDSSLPKRLIESTWHHASSDLKHDPAPSGLKSRDEGQMRSLLVRPLLAPTASHENALGLPGRRRACMASRRSAPESGRLALRIFESVCSASVRIRASLGMASSMLAAPTENVR